MNESDNYQTTDSGNESAQLKSQSKPDRYLEEWQRLKLILKPLLESYTPHTNEKTSETSSEHLEQLQQQLHKCIAGGRSTLDLAERSKLQWLTREIGDYIIWLYEKYPETVIEPFNPENATINNSVNLPFSRNNYFTGRDAELDAIHNFFATSKTLSSIRSLALVGMGGIGKTQIALEYAYRYGNQYLAIYWLQADDIDQLLGSISELAEQLIPNECEHDDLKIVAQNLKRYFEKQSGWLLIVDNADDLSILKKYLPQSGNGCILLTTCSSQIDSSLQQISISTLQPHEGKSLLLYRAKQLKEVSGLKQVEQSELEAAEELARQLGMLPLALDQAGAYIGKENITFEEYLTLYQQAERGKELRETRGQLSGEHTSSSTTYTLALEQVDLRDKEAADLIRACAFLAPEAIPKRIFTENPDIWEGSLAARLQKPLGFDELCQSATRYSLLQWDSGREWLSIHPVVQQVIRDGLSEEEQKKYITRVILAVNGIFPEEMEIRFGSREILRNCDLLSPQARKALEWIKDRSLTIPAAGHLMNKVSSYLFLRCRYPEAEDTCQNALSFWQELSIAKDLSTEDRRKRYLARAISLNNLAELHHTQGNYDEARPLFEEALKIRQDELPSDHFLVGQSLHNLARLEAVFSNYSQAEKCYLKALKINEKIELEKLRPLLARSYNDLGQLYYLQAKYTEAERNYQKALEINQEVLGENHLHVASNLDHLGDVYMAQTRFDEAEKNYSQALGLRKTYLRGEEYPAIADSHTRLALLYQVRKEYEKADYDYNKALGIREKLFDENHTDVASSYNNLAVLYQEQGLDEEAEELYLKALNIYKKALGEKHPTVATSYNNLALFYHQQERYDKAENFYQKALILYKQTLGKNHYLVANCYNNLALLYQEWERYGEAEPLLIQSLELRKRLLGEENLDIADSLDNLALLYQEWERYGEAEPLLIQSLELRKRLLGEEDLDIADNLDNLALLYQEWERYGEAEPLFIESLELQKRLLGEEDLDIAYSLDNLALLYQEWERYGEAEPLFKQALELRERLLGEEDLAIAYSLDNLALLYQEWGRYGEAEPLLIQSLELQKRLLGEENLAIAYSLDNLALLYQDQERYEEAEPLLIQSLELQKRLLGEEDLDIAYSLDNLALLYQEWGQYEKATELLTQLLSMLEQPLGSEEPYIINLKYRLSQVRNQS